MEDPVGLRPHLSDPLPVTPDLVLHGPPSPGRAVLLLPGYGDTSAVFTDRLDLIDPDSAWLVAVAEPFVEGPHGPMWYTVDDDGPDPDGVARASAAIDAAVDQVARIAGIDRSAVVIGGHSQGGAAALATSLDPAFGSPPAAIAALAAYLPHREGGLDGSRVDGRSVLMVHGVDDGAVEPIRGRGAARALERWGARVDWHDVAGGHRLGAPLLEPLARWLSAMVEASGSSPR